MNIKKILQDPVLQELEDQIIMEYENAIEADEELCDYSLKLKRYLIKARRKIINQRVLQRQDLLLPNIIAFNDTLRETLKSIFDKAYAVYETNKCFGNIYVAADCYLSDDYPQSHPIQSEDRQTLWDAILFWNKADGGAGATYPLMLTPASAPSYEEYLEMDSPSSNWNDGLGQNLTKDLHLINAFPLLFDHTDLAITDFIYCRNFQYEIRMSMGYEIQNSF